MDRHGRALSCRKTLRLEEYGCEQVPGANKLQNHMYGDSICIFKIRYMHDTYCLCVHEHVCPHADAGLPGLLWLRNPSKSHFHCTHMYIYFPL